MSTRFCAIVCPFLILFANSAPVLAQSGSGVTNVTVDVEHLTRMGVEERLDRSYVGLLGDRIDLNTGSVVFEHVDVSIPGNSGLEIAVRRKRTQGWNFSNASVANFGDWQFDVPRISILAPLNVYQGQNVAQIVPPPTWTRQLCGVDRPGPMISWPPLSTTDPVIAPNLITDDDSYSNGLDLTIPGAGSKKILNAPANVDWPTGVIKVTNDYWTLRCTTTDDGANGFIATAPDGTEYHFKKLVYREASPVSLTYQLAAGTPGAGGPLTIAIPRVQAILLATEVRDVHGNWVKYEYTADGSPTRIHSNDLREIRIHYDGPSIPKNAFQILLDTVINSPSNYIGRITAHGREWSYDYSTNASGRINLTSVTLPDQRSWSMNLSGMDNEAARCFNSPILNPVTVSLTHPNGASGNFTFSEKRMFKGTTGINDGPLCDAVGNDPQGVNYYRARVLTQKTLSGAAYGSETWTYSYLEHPNSGSAARPSEKWTQVIDPLNYKTITRFHNLNDLEGLTKRVEVYETAGSATPLETTDYSYIVEAPVGDTYLDRTANIAPMTKPRFARLTTVKRGADEFYTRNSYNSSQNSSTYSFGNPIKIETWSNLLSNEVRETDVVYNHNKAEWVLGLPATVTRNGILFDEYIYDSLGRVERHEKFGSLYMRYGYHTDADNKGALRWTRDATDRVWDFLNYHRGLPQQINRPDSRQVFRTVNDHGWVVSEQNARNYTTSYEYTDMGRLERIDRPAPFDDTTITYQLVDGITTQTSVRGRTETATWYDSLMRPYRVRTRPLSGGGVTSHVRTGYDALGRPTFVSFPSTAFWPIDGTNTSYDALGRVTSVRENVSPNAETQYEYLSGNQIRVTDPSLAQTTTTFRSFDAPVNSMEDGEVIRVVDPLGAVTTFDRDIHGNIETFTQTGFQNGFNETIVREFDYDDRFNLCRHSTPEMGDELFTYDVLDRMQYSSRGEPSGGGCATPTASIRTAYGYDDLDRPTLINFPTGTDDVVTSYDPNGNITRITRGNIVWDYTWNEIDLLNTEKLTLDGASYLYDYDYTDEGYMLSMALPSGDRVQYAPNGLGQPTETRVGTTRYIDNAVYHVSGQLASADLENGHAFTQGVNARQLVDEIRSLKGAVKGLDLGFQYDPRSKVTSILNGAVSGENRSFTYDPKGRLLTASGPWGTGSFKYDALDNIRQKVLGSRTVDIEYNPDNLVGQVTDTANPLRKFMYDNRGNTLNDGRFDFVYDFANQPVSAIGGSSGGSGGVSVNSPISVPANGEATFAITGGTATDVDLEFTDVDDGSWNSHFEVVVYMDDTQVTTRTYWPDSVNHPNSNGVTNYNISTSSPFNRIVVREEDSSAVTATVTATIDASTPDGSSSGNVSVNSPISVPADGEATFMFTGGTATDVDLEFTNVIDGSWNSHFEVVVYMDDTQVTTRTYWPESVNHPNADGVTSYNITTGSPFNRIVVREEDSSAVTATVTATINASTPDSSGGGGSVSVNSPISVPADGEATFTLTGGTASDVDLEFTNVIDGSWNSKFDVVVYMDNAQVTTRTYWPESVNHPNADGVTSYNISTSSPFNRIVVREEDSSAVTATVTATINASTPDGSGGSGGGNAVNATYAYDGRFKRVRRIEDGETVHSIYSTLGALRGTKNITTGKTSDYFGIGPIQVRAVDGVYSYTIGDHLGSASVGLDMAGNVSWRESYTPFGEKRLNPAANDNEQGYTGHLFDAATGLHYMQARYFDPTIGRFLSTDPIGYQDQFNLYAYVHNDPINNIDPDGRIAFGLASKAFKILRKGGDVGATFAGAAADARAVFAAPGTSSLGARALAAVSLASEVASPVSVRDGKAIAKGAGNIADNALKGKQGEALTRAKLGDNVAGEQVSFRTSDGSLSRPDFVTKDGGIVETKTGGASLTGNQQKLFDDVNSGTPVTPVGKNAADAGLTPGRPTVMKSCEVDRPC